MKLKRIILFALVTLPLIYCSLTNYYSLQQLLAEYPKSGVVTTKSVPALLVVDWEGLGLVTHHEEPAMGIWFSKKIGGKVEAIHPIYIPGQDRVYRQLANRTYTPLLLIGLLAMFMLSRWFLAYCNIKDSKEYWG